jgi:hypothetical protein
MNHDAKFYDASGNLVDPGQPLVALTTYYVELGGDDSVWSSVQWKYDASIVITSFTYASTNLPSGNSGERRDFWGGIRTWDAAADGWSAEAAITTTAVAGGTAGTQLVHVGGIGSRRLRCIVVVGATGGKLRCIPNHKGV